MNGGSDGPTPIEISLNFLCSSHVLLFLFHLFPLPNLPPPAAVSMSLSDKEILKRTSSLKFWAHSGDFQGSGSSRAGQYPLSGSSISFLGSRLWMLRFLAQVLYLFTVGKIFVILFLLFVVVPFIRLGGGRFGHTVSIHLLLPHIFFSGKFPPPGNVL